MLTFEPVEGSNESVLSLGVYRSIDSASSATNSGVMSSTGKLSRRSIVDEPSNERRKEEREKVGSLAVESVAVRFGSSTDVEEEGDGRDGGGRVGGKRSW